MPYILKAKARLKLKHKLHDMCISLCNRLRDNHILVQKGVTNHVKIDPKIAQLLPNIDMPNEVVHEIL